MGHDMAPVDEQSGMGAVSRRAGSRSRAVALALAAAVVLPGAGAAAQPADPTDGSGILVAVIGTGVDYTHAALGGPGTLEAFASNDPETVEPGSFPNAVVVGGYDLAGDAYSADCPVPTPVDVRCAAEPRPDGDPLDMSDGAGTRAAGVVLGAAPGVRIVALKVYGQPQGVPATTDLTAAAARWILAHNRGESVPGAAPEGERIDVALFDSGRPFGADQQGLAEAIADLAASGVTVVAPAGDPAGLPMAIGGIAAAPAALAVTAVHGGDETAWGVRVDWTGADGSALSSDMEAVEGRGLPLLADVGPVVAPLAWYGLACNVDGQPAEPAQPVDGRIALVERGTCPFTEKLASALAKGALAVLFFSDNRAPTAPGCGGACPTEARLPAVMIARAEGLRLRDLLLEPTAVTATLDADLRLALTWLDGVLVDGGARGPAPDGAIKPQVAALGAGLSAPVAGSGDGSADARGSLVASATAAALAARVRQLVRARGHVLDGADVAAILQSHASPDVHEGRNDSGAPASIALQGAGRVGPAALAATALVRTDRGIAELGFGVLAASAAPTRRVRQLTVRNLSAEPRAFDVRFEPVGGELPAVTLAFEPRRLHVGGGETAVLTVTLTVDPAGLASRGAATGRALADPGGLPAAFEGRLVLEDAVGGERLIVPVLALPRGAACVGMRDAGGSGARDVVLTNPCPITGTLSAARLVGTDPAESSNGSVPEGLDITDVGFRYGPEDPADPASPVIMEWHVATAGPRSVPAGARFDVLVDRDQDGAWDRVVTAVHGPDARGGLPAGEWVALSVLPWEGAVPDLSGPYPDIRGVAYDLDESVTVLRIPAEALAFDPASGGESFDMAVVAHRTASAALWPAEALDAAPDGALTGERLVFDQDRAECLQLTVGGALVAVAGGDLTVAPDAAMEAILVLGAGCSEADAAGGGFLMGYPLNDPDASAGQHQRLLWEGASADSGRIYLPVAHGRP